MDQLAHLTSTMRSQPAGHEFAKFAWMLARHPGEQYPSIAAEAGRFDLSSPNLKRVLMAAVAAGTTTDAGWAAELAPLQAINRDFVSVIQPQTILGRIPYTPVPMLTKSIVLTADDFNAAWVQAGEPIPMSRGTFDAPVMLQPKKVATMVPFTEESVQSWSAAIQAMVLDMITRAVVYASDLSLLDPSFGATAARPAALTHGISQSQSTGPSAAQATADLKALIQALIDGGSDLSRVRIVMSPSSALHLSQLLTTGGNYAFPDLTAVGGTIFGVPVIVSRAAVQVGSPTSHIIAAIDGAKVLVADDGQVLAEASRAGAVQFNDAPGSGAQNLVSLFQTGARVVRIIRILNFQRAHDSAVAWFAAAY